MFADVNQADDARAESVVAEAGSSGGGLNTATAPPVMFYPNGTTSSVELQVQHEQGQALTVSMRGLTGIVSLSDLYVSEAAR